MPQTIKPIIDTTIGHSYNLDPGGDWSWLRKQDYSPAQTQAAIGNKVRGSIGGGPTFSQFLADDPKKFTVLATPPQLTSAVLQGTSNANGGKKVGQLSLDLIDPFGTMAEATGSFAGNDQPVAGNGGTAFDPGRFLAGKGVDLFGQGDAGVPARLADYALALPIAVLNKMRGVSSAEPSANTGLKYRFQADPGYWDLLGAAKTDDQLRIIASAVAGQYVDPSRNGALVQQLFDQFKSDRDTALTAISSGNDRLDYIAKWAFATDVAGAAAATDAAAGNGFSEASWRSSAVGLSDVSAAYISAIPFVGTQLASGIAPIDVMNNAWAALTVDQRRAYFERAGIQTGILDFAVQLPLLSGLGGVLAKAKASEGIAGTLYKGYDTILRSAGVVMGSGLIVAGTNWALEAASPWYSEILGTEIDRARPISKSSVAGVVNELGFWASGSFGVVPAVQLAMKAESKVATALGAAAGTLRLPHVTVGSQELAFFRDGYGGSMVRDELARAGLTGVDTSIKASFISHLMNYAEKVRREPLEAALRGEDTPWAEINAMGPNEREAWANDGLARGAQDGPGVVEAYTRLLAYARRDRPILPSEEGRQAWDVAHNVGRTLDEQVTADVGRVYGPDFIASRRIVGTYVKADMEAWARAKVSELGGDGSKLGSHDEEGWAKIIRTLHQHEYHTLNGELASSIELEASAEAGRIAMVASDHLFRDNAEAIIGKLQTADAATQRTLIADTIRNRREAAAWFTDHYKPTAGHAKTPESVSADAFQSFLEDSLPGLPTRRLNTPSGSATAFDPINAFQTKLDAQGTWSLAFKPVDEAGNLVSYTKLRSGGVLRSPWVEYPLSGGDSIELGNRGYLASKLDSLTRGFRTRRLTEYQRGSMFRIVTGKANVLPEQIDAFHEGILKLAHDSRVQPQTVGAVAKLPEIAFSLETKKKIDALAESVFGPGDLIGHDGKPVKMDWPAVIGSAYRQSFKLNLTAGLTSYLKTLGPVGAAAAVASDIMYTAWRFGFSPLFKGGELLESAQLNAMRGVFRRDPTTEATFVWGGLGNDGSVLSSELNFDQMTQALTGRGDFTPSQRLAASLSLHARHLPETLGLTAEKASTQEIAATRPFRPTFTQAEGLDPQRLIDEWGWTKASVDRKIASSQMVPTSLLEPLREIDRRARPEPSLHESLDSLAADMQGNGIKAPLEIWWDPATNNAVVADGNHRLTIALEQGIDELPAYVVAHSTEEVGMAEQSGRLANPKPNVDVPRDGILKPSEIFGEADQPLPLPELATTQDELLKQLSMTFADEPAPRPYAEPVPTEAGGLLSELDRIVGENGVTPGLEGRAKSILDRLDQIEREHGDGGPVFRFADLSAKKQAELRARMFDSGDLRAPDADPLASSPEARAAAYEHAIDEIHATGGTVDPDTGQPMMALSQDHAIADLRRRLKAAREAPKWEPSPAELETAYAQFQRRPGAAESLGDVAGTPEALFDNALPAFAEEAIRKGAKGDLKKALDTFWHPTNYKQGQALALQIKLFRDSFPALLRASGNDGLIKVFTDLHIAEKDWAPWLLEDRHLLDGWLNTKAPEDLAKLLDHAGKDGDRAAWNELYASPEWETLTALWAINLQATRDEAFGVHFFSPYRSAIERTINHPVLGIYPASWTIKAAREWSKFMFDNRTFGELRLGMAPAQAIAATVRAQQAAWAQTHEDTLQHFLDKGPLGSTIFIFNLLMPGDWSSLPFPLSRSIREVLRGNTNPAKILAANLDFLGATRDGQLVAESLGELQSLIFGTPHPDPKRILTGVSAKGVDGQFGIDPR